MKKVFTIKNIIFNYGAYTIVILIISLFLLVLLNANRRLVVGSDFLNYFTAASIISQDRGDLIYDPEFNYNVQLESLRNFEGFNITVFRSFPLAAFILVPLTNLDVVNAYRFFVLFNIIICVLIAFLVLRTFTNIRNYYPQLSFSLFFYFPVLSTLQMGQMSLILTLLLMLVYLSLKNKNDLLAGVIASLLLIKIQYIIIVPFLFLLAKRRKHFFLGYLISIAVIFLISVYVVGIRALTNYPSFLLVTENLEWGSRAQEMFTFYAALTSLNLTNLFSNKILILVNFILYAVFLVFFIVAHKKIRFNNAFSAAIMFTVFFSVHSLAYDLTLLLIPFFIFLNRIFQKHDITFNTDYLAAAILFTLPAIVFFRNTFFLQFIFVLAGCYFLLSGNSIKKTKPAHKAANPEKNIEIS